MPYGRLADTDPDAWYRAARRIDQARLANETFQSVSRSTPSAPTKTISARPPPMSVDGDQREFDLKTRVITNGNLIIPEMFHSCALDK